jgi:predicted GNAT superfamily acetyltransferase
MTVTSALDIREITREEDFLRIAEIQKAVWGFEPADITAPHLIMLHQRLGGVVIGAFDNQDRLVAFCYSFFGLMGSGLQKTPIHWSHMLAVLPEFRGLGLGKVLKWKQREMVLERGVKICRWTFDPLETINTRLNIVTLGCVSNEYLFNVYGNSTGHLHSGLSTDRFIAHWQLDSHRVEACLADKPPRAPIEVRSLPMIFDVIDSDGSPTPEGRPVYHDSYFVGVPIPVGMQQIKVTRNQLAWEWRRITGEVFPELFSRGYLLVDVLSEKETIRPVAIYILERKDKG